MSQNYLEVQKLPRVSCFSSETLSHLGNLKSLRWGTRCSRVCRKQQRLSGHPCFKRSTVKVSILVPPVVCGNFASIRRSPVSNVCGHPWLKASLNCLPHHCIPCLSPGTNAFTLRIYFLNALKITFVRRNFMAKITCERIKSVGEYNGVICLIIKSVDKVNWPL